MEIPSKGSTACIFHPDVLLPAAYILLPKLHVCQKIGARKFIGAFLLGFEIMNKSSIIDSVNKI